MYIIFIKAIFTRLPRVIRVCFGFALQSLQCLVIGLSFSRASCPLRVFASSFDWFTGLFVSFVLFVIGQANNFGLGFTTLN